MSLAAGTRLGQYEIVGLLGAGGMGEVYRARDTVLGRDVAVKILPQVFAANPDRFARQVRALGQAGDVLLALSASGNSAAVLAAAEAAHAREMTVVALLGGNGGAVGRALRETDVQVCVPHERAARVHEVHLLTLHCLCDGIDAQRLRLADVTVRQRAGRERLRLQPSGHSRSVKRLLQDAGIAPWRRASLPFVFCGDALVAVAGLGIDSAFRASPDAPGFTLAWHPRHRQARFAAGATDLI